MTNHRAFRSFLGAVIGVTVLIAAGCGGGGGGGGGGGTSDTTNPSVAFAAASSGEVTRSADDGVTMRVAVTANDDVAVTSVDITLTAPGGASATVTMTYDAISGTWRATTMRVPPIAGYDEYVWTATASDASGKTGSASGSFRIDGPTPPSTGGRSEMQQTWKA